MAQSQEAAKPPSPFADAAPAPSAALPNPFTREMPERPKQVSPINTQLHVRRTGIIPLAIGASRIVKGRDDKKRQFTAHERSHEMARADRDGRELTVSVVCFECRKPYVDLDALVADHPTTLEMREANEAHTWAYWCEDNYDAHGVEQAEQLKSERDALQRAHNLIVGPGGTISKASDVEKIMAERKRAEEIAKMVEETEKKRLKVAESIIGLMSDTPPTV